MSTLMLAPNLFAYIGVSLLVMTLPLFFLMSWVARKIAMRLFKIT